MTIYREMTMEDAIRIYKDAGGHFFDKAAMRFFNSVIETDLMDNGCFVTSERMEENFPKRYTIRAFSEDYTTVEDVSEFQAYGSFADAVADAKGIRWET